MEYDVFDLTLSSEETIIRKKNRKKKKLEIEVLN